MAVLVPECNTEFAERYRDLNFELKDTINNLYNDSWAPVNVKDIEADLVNHDSRGYKDELLELKDHFNSVYDPEDPDCASILLEIEKLLEYLD